jgi:tRNA A37 threonylcarbamoyladenosine dehydratase
MFADPHAPLGGIERLFGRGALARLGAARVAVVGLGGVGSWAVEALARSGVGALVLIDFDAVAPSNTNRQLHALRATLGRPKAEVMAERVEALGTGCHVEARRERFGEGTAETLFGGRRFDGVIDAIDASSDKCRLVAWCRSAGLPVVCCGGAGGRTDPARVRIDDLAFTRRDPLLRDVRKHLRQRFGFSRDAATPFGVAAVYSEERPVFPCADGAVRHEPGEGPETAIDREARFGTASFVTGVFGLAAASVLVRRIVAQ